MTGPFEAALGRTMQNLPAGVRAHLSTKEGRRCYRGTMNLVWRRRGLRGFLAVPFLHLAARGETLFPETGRGVPFLLENSCVLKRESCWHMSWKREFFFPGKTRCFTAEMYFDARRGAIVDLLGKHRQLEVELHPRVTDGAFLMTSGRQWLRTRIGRIPLPRLFTGQATVREEAAPNGQLKIRVTIRNPLLGAFFGYEGLFAHEPSPTK